MKYLNESVSCVGLNIGTVIASVPGQFMIFRGIEPLNREKQVDCLVAPKELNNGYLNYTNHNLYLSANMIEREDYEDPDKNRILVIDHLRDKNEQGTLKIIYTLQDTSPKQKTKNTFMGHIDHYRLFKSLQ